MCGRFTLTEENEDWVADVLGVPKERLEEWTHTPRWNIAPMQDAGIVVLDREDRVIRPATWGLVNWWDTDRRGAARQINARSESVATARPFREAFEQRRCLVPADGFFEWTGDKKQRRPFWFHRPEREVFAFAGLYSRVRLVGEAEPTTTFTILTTSPNELVAHIHDRMPVILPDEDAMAAWLRPDADPRSLHALCRPVDDRYLVARAVTSRVNSVANDDPACLEEEDPETQGALI